MSGFTLTPKTDSNTDGFFIQTAAVYTALLSVFAAYYSVFDVGITLRITALLLLAVVPALELLVRNRKYLGIKVLLLVILLGIAAFFYRESLLKGIAPFVNNYIEQRNLFYFVSQPGIEQSPDTIEDLIVLAGIQILFGLILAIVLKIRRCSILALLVMLIPVILAATVGHMPSTITSWGLLAAGSLYLITFHRRAGTFPLREITTATCIFIVLYLCTLAIQPQIANYKKLHQQKYDEIRAAFIESQKQQIDIRGMIQKDLEINSNYAKGGIGKGSLDNLAEHQSLGTVEMEVTVNELPESRIYLRAFTGTSYTGKQWKELSASLFSSVISPFAGDEKRRELMTEPFTRIQHGNNDIKQVQMKIDLLEASADYGYSPYYAEIPDTDTVKLDAYVKGNLTKSREYTYYPKRQVENISSSELAEPSELWDVYQGFVQDTYTEYPDNLEQFAELCTSIKSSSENVEETGALINQFFSSALHYSLTPGGTPPEQDFVEYFLFENKQGFCVHFASAATLIYRECGYPARYVEGYAIPPEQFEHQEDGTYKAVVTDEMAHAWCETFDTETGWQVREHTLPYQEDDYTGSVDTQNPNAEVPSLEQNGNLAEVPENPAQKSDEPENTDAEPQNENSTVDSQGISANKNGDTANAENSGGSQIPQPLSSGSISKAAALTGILLFIFCLAVLSCILQQKIRRQKKLRDFRITKENLGIAAIYDAIYEICIFMGMEQTQQTDWETAEQIKAEFPQLTEEEWAWIYDCAVRAAFTGEYIGKEEQKRFYDLYHTFRKAILKELKGWKKFWFLYGKGM